MTNGKACPVCKCKSWEENNPTNWIIVATVSGVVTAVLTALLAKWWGITNLERQRMLTSQTRVQGRYRSNG